MQQSSNLGEPEHASFPCRGRVLKTALAVTLSIVIAQQLGMERVTLAANHSSKRRSLVVAGMEVMRAALK